MRTVKRIQVTVVGVGALVFAVFLATGGTVAEQTAFLSGSVVNRDCTCPVRLDAAYASDSGLGLYQRLTFPCALVVLPDAGRDVQLPPMPQGARAALDVIDWNDCTLAASTGPVAALWGAARPVTGAGVVKPWCRARLPGQPCLRVLSDGGSGSFGDRNVFPCAQAVTPATCERASGNTHYLGDDPEAL